MVATPTEVSSPARKKPALVGSFLEQQPRSELEDQIIRQVEHYFGDYNLPTDKFMQELIKGGQGWVFMSTLLTFRRLARLSTEPDQVFTALAKSRSGLLQLDPEGGRLRRDPNLPLPDAGESRSLALQERTVYVSGFDTKETLDDLLKFFEGGFERVMNVRMRHKRTSAARCSRDFRAEAEALVAATVGLDSRERMEAIKAEEDNNREGHGEFLGSVFVVFGTKQAAQQFLGAPVRYRGKQLYTKLQRDYLVEKSEHNDQFLPDTLHRTVWVHGFDDRRITQMLLAKFFSSFEGAVTVRKRVYRDRRDEPWQFTGAAFVTFSTVELANKMLELGDRGELKYRGDRLRAMWQKEFYEKNGYFKREREEMARNEKAKEETMEEEEEGEMV